MYEFSETVMMILSQSKWTQDRCVSIDKYEAYFWATQQPYSQVVLEFLSSFAGIEISRPSRLSPKSLFFCAIDPIESYQRLGGERVKYYSENWLHKPLCAIAHYGDYDHSEILMAVTGESYSVFDTWVVKLGDTVSDLIETLCLQKGGERIMQEKKKESE